VVDVILLATIVVFFVAGALLIRACGHIADSARAEARTEETEPERDSRRPA
jgi:hypothetical protein